LQTKNLQKPNQQADEMHLLLKRIVASQLKKAIVAQHRTVTSSKINDLIDLYNKQKSSVYNSSASTFEQLQTPTTHDLTANELQTVESKFTEINSRNVFANNEIDLNEIQIYGFDYDYTLAQYNQNLFRLIFNMARDQLIQSYNYPTEISHLTYQEDFPIRGLHFDKRNGWLMKIDSYNHIQLGSVYHGMRKVADIDVKRFYNGTHVSIDNIGYTNQSQTMHNFTDLFCHPEICLIASLIEYFLSRNIQFSPDYIFEDVRKSIDYLHASEVLHREITKALKDFLVPIGYQDSNPENCYRIKEFLRRLQKSHKKIFLITNSNYWFVDMGMRFICSDDWKDYFDVIICNARKPSFFMSKTRPFRQFDPELNFKSWDKVSHFEKGQIYYEGNLFQMLENTGWSQSKVLYFGDNLFNDLQQPFLHYGWRTGAIISELNDEIRVLNMREYRTNLAWLLKLENLIQSLMLLAVNSDRNYDESVQLLLLEKNELEKRWLQERNQLRIKSKSMFNPHFGSLFRTNNNPTFFSRRLSRFADIYTSHLSNLLEYPINYNFIPRRTDLAHEQYNFNTAKL